MKKMRKLIPAFAMLMVAAIMMTTASFAWFTMNDAVTVSGLQVQAKASGSLLISENPIHNLNTKVSDDVQLASNVNVLTAISYKGTTLANKAGALNIADTYAAGWYEPTDSKISNSTTGANNGTYKAVTTTAGYALAKAFYIATAGETLKKTDLTITLDAPSFPAGSETHKAYSAAIYLIDKTDTEKWGKSVDTLNLIGNATETLVPNAILHVDTFSDRNTIKLENVTIPSIVGATDDQTAVGLEVVAVFYVDGALQSNTQASVLAGYVHAPATGAFDATAAYYTFAAATLTDPTANTSVVGYYVKNGNNYQPATGLYVAGTEYYTRSAAAITPEDRDLTDVSAKGWFKATEAYNVSEKYCYVRSADVTSNGSSLRLTFKSSGIVTN